METAIRRGINFRVIIVDSRPQQYGSISFKKLFIIFFYLYLYYLGLKSARRLLSLNVKCTYVLINAVPFIISEVCI